MKARLDLGGCSVNMDRPIVPYNEVKNLQDVISAAGGTKEIEKVRIR
jgi:hypothetical protein